MSSSPTPASGPFAVFLTVGASWALVVSIFAAFLQPPGLPTAGSWVALAFVALLLTLAIGATGTLLSRFAFELLRGARYPRLLDFAQSLVVGLAMTFGALSLIKYRATRVHLGWNDLRFLFGSLGQVHAEAGSRERALIWLSLLLPLTIATLVYLGLRARRHAPLPPLRDVAALLVVSVLGLGILAWLQPFATVMLTEIAPGASAIAHHFRGKASERPLLRRFTPDSSRHRPIVPYVAPPDFRRANVVVLMLESIPWSRLFGPEARPEATPHLLALAAESTVFSRAYATATHSDYAQTSILASLHPRKFEHHDFFTDLSYPRTLPWDLLAPLGYRSAVFSCQNEGWGNMRSFIETPALELFRHSPDWPDAPRRGDGAESKVFERTVVDSFLTWIEEKPATPFVAYLNFQATHYPYIAPEGEPLLFEPAEIDFPTTFLSYPRDKIPVMENRFYNALAYVDRETQRLIDGLAAAGVWDDTVLLVVSDHGEAFYEHGIPTHGTTLFEEQVRTAMFVRLPGVPPREVRSPVSVLDAVPAVVRFLGLPEHGNFQGRSDVLAADYDGAGRPFPVTIQGMTREDGLLRGRWKFIGNHDRGERALFDLENDPGERTNLVAARSEEREVLRKELAAFVGDQLVYYRERGWEQGVYPPRLP